jgi:hypothetical protein
VNSTKKTVANKATVLLLKEKRNIYASRPKTSCNCRIAAAPIFIAAQVAAIKRGLTTTITRQSIALPRFIKKI